MKSHNLNKISENSKDDFFRGNSFTIGIDSINDGSKPSFINI